MFLLTFVSCINTMADNQGVKLVNENFDYAAGIDLAGNGNWKSFMCFYNQSSDPVKLVEGNLTYPGYEATGVGNSVRPATIGTDASMSFIPQEGVIYASMLVNVMSAPADGDYFFSFGDLSNSTTESFGKLHIKNVEDKLVFSATRKSFPGASTPFTETKYDFNTTDLLVIKYTQNGDNSKVELFVNPDPAAAEPVALISNQDGSGTSKLLRHIVLYQDSLHCRMKPMLIRSP